ncbi:hypothetical protein [Streptomyces cavernicola]|uniref:Uncharacterized protein n=1 Tax=Streptomyces cavernicola TaxID=3043613 RepID=A0ABT6SKY2_9ACTN|nr:hypothetical protein [Streptomyces sp. B-S-A6]MDI3408322.1 hypothetical protein [Streptomyces sp. B-S-A6]
MSHDTAPTENGPAVDEQPAKPRRLRFPLRLVRTTVLDELDAEATAFAKETEHWFAAYTDEGLRADRAEENLDEAQDRVADLEQQVEELSGRLADAGREAEHQARCLRTVSATLDQERADRMHLQQAGRDLVHAFTSFTRGESPDAESTLNAVGRVFNEHAHRFDLGRADLADMPWTPKPEEPAAPHALPRGPADTVRHLEAGCQTCATSLAGQAEAYLVKVAHLARDTDAPVALLVVLLELEGRNSQGAIAPRHHRGPTEPDTTEARDAEPPADPITDQKQTEMVRAAYRYPHDATHPALIGDHLPHCEACTAALGTLPNATVIEARHAAAEYGKTAAIALIASELDRRGIPAGTEQEATR